VLSLEDTVGKWRPDLPREWASITLRQLLNHTSGIPDYSKEKGFIDALLASLLVAPSPVQLLSYIEKPKPSFTPGTKYAYSNSDNVIVGLMIEAATGSSYERALHNQVAAPFDPMGDGRARSDKIMLPESMMVNPAELRRWIARAFKGTAALPAKAPKAKAARKSAKVSPKKR